MFDEACDINCINDGRAASLNTGRYCVRYKCALCFFYCYVWNAGYDDTDMRTAFVRI